MKGELGNWEVEIVEMSEGKKERWLFNLYEKWERVAVIHGFVCQLIKERKFLKNIHH